MHGSVFLYQNISLIFDFMVQIDFLGNGEHVSISVGQTGELHATLSGVLSNRR